MKGSSDPKGKNQNRLREAILFVACLSRDDPYFGTDKLGQVLFFADAQHYLRTGKTSSGATYFKAADGPALGGLEKLLTEMADGGDLVLKGGISHAETVRESTLDYFLSDQPDAGRWAAVPYRVIPQREPDMSAFTGDETAALSLAVARCAKMTASMMCEESRKLQAWKLAKGGALLNLNALYVADEQGVTPEDIAFAKGLAS